MARALFTIVASSLLAIAPYAVDGSARFGISPTTAMAAQGKTPVTGAAEGADVARGCEAPSSTSFRRAYFLDPARGAQTGDGSRAHPWGRLEDVLGSMSSRVRPGDVLYLFDGDHGNVVASAMNAAFVEVTAAPGQTPVLESLRITGSRWRFSHLKIQSLKGVSKADYGKALVAVTSDHGPANNIILDSNTISPQDDVSAWSSGDWKVKGLRGLNIGGNSLVSCVTVIRNRFYNNGGGAADGGNFSVALFADHALLSDNIIDNFADDAVEFGGNDVEIARNTITNNVGIEDGNHNDGIQGLVPGGAAFKDVHAFTGLTIKDNVIIRQTKADLHHPIVLQGIDNFAAVPLDWYNVEVINNLVVTNVYHGITFGAVHHATISNNTVLADGRVTTQLVKGVQGERTTPGDTVWILVQAQVNNLPTPGGGSSDVVVSGNIAQTMRIESAGARARDNVVLGPLTLTNGGSIARYKAPGVYGERNTVDPSLVGEFEDFRPGDLRFDVRLKPSSRMAGKGAAPSFATGAPATKSQDPN